MTVSLCFRRSHRDPAAVDRAFGRGWGYTVRTQSNQMAHEMSGLQGWLKLDLDAIQARSDKVQNFTIQGFGVSEMLAAAELAVDSAEDVPALLARVRWLEKDNAAMQQEERDRARGGHWIEEFN